MIFATKHKPSRQAPCSDASTDRPIRSLAKAASWRVTGSIDTILLSWLFTGDMTIAAAIGLTEVLTKTILFYFHERIWNRIQLGRCIETSSIKAGVADPMKNSCIEQA